MSEPTEREKRVAEAISAYLKRKEEAEQGVWTTEEIARAAIAAMLTPTERRLIHAASLISGEPLQSLFAETAPKGEHMSDSIQQFINEAHKSETKVYNDGLVLTLGIFQDRDTALRMLQAVVDTQPTSPESAAYQQRILDAIEKARNDGQ